MATATPTQPPSKAIHRSADPLVFWHLLSLDAPTIAALWTWFIASANHIRLPLSSAVAMAIAVWMLYAADRLMDARLIDTNQKHHEALEARHYFHHRHRTTFLTGILFASIALAILLPRLEAEAIRLYLILAALVFGYFILIHATHGAHRLPKEIAVGLFFSAATFIPTVARRPDLRLSLLPSALFFAALCSLNCLFIYAWEHGNPHVTHASHPATRFALRHLPFITIIVLITGIALSLFDRQTPWPIPCAIAISAPLLLLLDKYQRRIAPITLRAAADLALTTPLLLLPFLHR